MKIFRQQCRVRLCPAQQSAIASYAGIAINRRRIASTLRETVINEYLFIFSYAPEDRLTDENNSSTPSVALSAVERIVIAPAESRSSRRLPPAVALAESNGRIPAE